MKKRIHQILAAVAFCVGITGQALAQQAVPPPPPAPPAGGADRMEIPDQPEIIIRQKGGKDAKVTLEIKNGDFFINGKPLEKFDDGNIIIERKEPGNDETMMIMNDMDMQPYLRQKRSYYDDREKKRIQKSIRIKMNEAFLGVASKKSEKGGATIIEITKGSPAEKAGLKNGDQITRVNDSLISSPESLFEAVHQYKAGEKIKIGFTRAGKPMNVSATLEKSAEMPKNFNYNYDYKFNMPPMPPMPDLNGMDLGNWGDPQPKLGITVQEAEDGKGLNVLEVADSSAASKAGLHQGDVITQVNGADVNSTNELKQGIMGARQKAIVQVKILRGGQPQTVDLRIPRKLKTADL